LGILAHVDAGKTTLTERLLYAAGVIDQPGSVDQGSTQTDTLDLERQRGITIKSAVVSFRIDDLTVNLIDTPGHPDFIAEVERVLSVLDGAVLVVSAVEGVQPQTRVLMRTLRRLRIPTLVFVNKIDRGGAADERVLRELREKLELAVLPMGSVSGLGTRGAEVTPSTAAHAGFVSRLVDLVAGHDDRLLAAYVDDETTVPYRRLWAELAAQTGQARVHPVFFGSAVTGAGVAALTAGVRELLPAAQGDPGGPVSGAVFKIERGPAGEKIAYARLFSGTVRVRDRLQVTGVGGDGQGGEGKVTAISVFDRGRAVRRPSVAAGQIGKLWGLAEVRVGDQLGVPRTTGPGHHFDPPTLETVVVPARPADKGALHLALAQLAEQDPLIDLRQQVHVSLYGEVQKEVIGATLAADFGLEVGFRETTTICVERPLGTGAAVERLHKAPNPFLATVGLRVEPAPAGSGVRFAVEAELGSMPLAFFAAVEDTVRQTLRQGLYGWEVTDCQVAMTHSGYLAKHSLGHQRFTKSMSSTGEDFRKLTPLVLMDALRQARTVVCEPIHRFRLEVPDDTLGTVLPVLARLEAVPGVPARRGPSYRLEGEVPAARIHELQQQLSALTRGEGVLETAFDRYRPVRGPFPTRPRTDHNPLDRREYLRHALRRA
jgi:ribosomal protection tetracycline resistance protein